jgi:hypothetical protein
MWGRVERHIERAWHRGWRTIYDHMMNCSKPDPDAGPLRRAAGRVAGIRDAEKAAMPNGKVLDKQSLFAIEGRSDFVLETPPRRWAQSVLEEQLRHPFRLESATTGALGQDVCQFQNVVLRESRIQLQDPGAASA